MKTRLLKKLRKEAKKQIYLYSCGFEESYKQCFSHVSTQVEIHVSNMEGVMKKYETQKDYAKVDGVDFAYGVLGGVAFSWGWFGACRLDEAKKILRKLRREYILQEVERLRYEQWFEDSKKEYEGFKKYIASL